MGGGELILLDTHALIWLDQDNPALGKRARRLADDALGEDGLAVAAISFWEVAMLAAKGRITMTMPLQRWRIDLLRMGVVEVPLDGQIAVAAAELADLHGDPADRMIVAAALACGATLVTADKRLLQWSGPVKRHDASR